MHQHRVPRTNHKPSFFWQGVLILAPVLVLAKLGAVALTQDKRMAQHEAELRAQDIADETVERVWNKIQSPPDNAAPTNAVRQFEIDAQGRLVSPKPYSPSPLPAPLDDGAQAASSSSNYGRVSVAQEAAVYGETSLRTE